MKSIVKTSRLTGQLEKLFRMLNHDFFNDQLEEPIITVQSTPRAYGHYSVSPIWTVNGEEQKHEINIGSGTLDRDIEYTVGTLLHECVHYYNDTVLKAQDCSRGGTYHNRQFKKTAESVGLIVTKSKRYGYAHTAPSDELIEWILDNDIQEILMNRNEGFSARGIGGSGTDSGSLLKPPKKPSSTRKYICPCCRKSVRATREIRIMCMDCSEQMIVTE